MQTSDLSDGYVNSYCVLIASRITPVHRVELEILSNVLRKDPYKFSILELVDSSATKGSIQQLLHTLTSVPVDTRILLFVAGEFALSSDGSTYYMCTNTDLNNLSQSAIPCTYFLTLPGFLPAKHIALIFDAVIELGYIQNFLQLGGPRIEHVTRRTAYQFMMRSPKSEQTLATVIANLLDTRPFEPMSMASIGYNTQDIYPGFHLYIKGSQDGDFIF